MYHLLCCLLVHITETLFGSFCFSSNLDVLKTKELINFPNIGKIIMATIFLIIYNLLIIVLFVPFLLLVLIFSGKYRKELFFKFTERFAIWNYAPKDKSKKTAWIHCSSLGEVRAVEPILSCLKEEYNVVLTAFTKTGREYAQKIQKADFSALLPIDLYPFMFKAFNIINPNIIILVETELWASMLYVASKKKVKIMTINGRMSANSFKVYDALSFFWKRFIGMINIILARSSDDAVRFSKLSDGKSQILVSGNIKYDRGFGVDVSRSNFGLGKDDKVFSAGSIREGEGEIICDAYIKVREKDPDVFFFAAPRHLSKIAEVKKIIRDKKIEYVLFSDILAGKKISERFILVDVFGRLQEIYSISDICFVGGSIVNKGGQNPIEPAACGKPVLFGKHMDNFKTESEVLLEYEGAVIVSDASDLALKIEKLFLDKDFLMRTGENALKAVNSQKGAIDTTVKTIKEYIN